ncbi:MAG TPA: glycoside hydrolase family 2 TIM barrel-domain containing protein [Candidatus Izemoplasmatales bacterium]|nr:glycoside hydrolase family 2 TIM barrel-domain containing protein [Candidatus Izemoplasmatales bacterium]
MRKIIPINFEWRFRPDFQKNYLEKDFEGIGFEEVMIPHTMIETPYNDFTSDIYQFIGSYFRDFEIEEVGKDQKVLLCFYGVMVSAEVYVNGNPVGSHQGGYTPFQFDITDYLNFNEKNRIFVKVDGHEDPDIPPFGNVLDYMAYSGIYREVELDIRPKNDISFVMVKTDESVSLKDDEMALNVRIEMEKDPGKETVINLNVRDKDNSVYEASYNHMFSEAAQIDATIQGITRWDIENPKMYTANIKVFMEGILLDETEVKFGFRTAKFAEDGFTLNNRKLKLVGLNRHQSYPYVGYAMPARMQRMDADILKYDLGCNIVRTSHYMQSDHFIERCDEIGLLVFEEIPGWQHIGGDKFKENTYLNLKTMIRHHANHPSIVLWGVRINESLDCHDFYEKTNEIAHEIDSIRQTGGVRYLKKSELLEDVYTYNDFSCENTSHGLENPDKVSERLKPYLVTEYNGHMYPTRRDDNEARKLEHALRHLIVLEDAFSYERISGAIGWCFSDYNTHEQFGSNDRVCYHGVTDMFRIPKYAAYTYMSQKNPNDPVLEVASAMTPGEGDRSILPATFIFTNCDYVVAYMNGYNLGKFYSEWKVFPNIPHAPIVIDDFIGDKIRENEPYKIKIADRIKDVLLAYNRHGFSMPLKYKLKMFDLLAFHHIKMDKAMDLYKEYVGNWGSVTPKYRFEGYVNDKLVKTVDIAQPKEAILKVLPDAVTLTHKDTYDVVRVIVKMEDEYGNIRPLARDVVCVETSEGLALIGPNQMALMNGAIGFFLKTTGKKGKAYTIFRVAGQQPVKIEFTIA